MLKSDVGERDLARSVQTHFDVWVSVGLFCFCLIHRCWQWGLLSESISHLSVLQPDRVLMQFLPAKLWQEHPAATLLYLQQTPPLPNLIYGLVVNAFPSAAARAEALVLISGGMTAVTAAFLYALLIRLVRSRLIAVFIALSFILNGEVVVMEYAELGQFFYEFVTMAVVVVAAWAAVSFSQYPARHSAFVFGSCIGILALSRAIFSYIEIPVLFWMAYRRRFSSRFLLVALVPMLVLHGGWALKQFLVQGQWLWATSTWGGANMQIGDLKRGDKRFGAWADVQTSGCVAHWPGYIQNATWGAFGFNVDATSALARFEQSAAARKADRRALQSRQLWVPRDSAAFRELSQCLQRLYARYWLEHPLRAVSSWWQSWAVYWSPIDSWAAAFDFVVVPSGSSEKLLVDPFWNSLKNFLQGRSYSVRQNSIALGGEDNGVFMPAKVMVLPVLPQVFSLMAAIGLHLLPLLAVATIATGRSFSKLLPAGFSFLLLIYGYVAVISNLVEFGENMRFRLPVEPIGWTIAVVAMSVLWKRRWYRQ